MSYGGDVYLNVPSSRKEWDKAITQEKEESNYFTTIRLRLQGKKGDIDPVKLAWLFLLLLGQERRLYGDWKETVDN